MQGVKINVDYKALKEAGTEVEKLKNRLSDLGSMDVPLHATLTGHGAANTSVGAFTQYNRSITEAITKMLKPQGGSWNTGPNGAQVYTSPGGVQYRIGGGDSSGRFDGSPLMDAAGGGVGKLARYAGLAMGVGGTVAAFSWMNNTAEKSKIYEMVNTDLQRRGGGFDKLWLDLGANFGYKPLEQQAIYDQFNTRMGLRGQQLKVGGVESMYWARRAGIPAAALADYQTGTFHTGPDITREKDANVFSEKLNAPVTLLFKAAVALGAHGRIVELMQKNQVLLTGVVANRGGRELSEAERRSHTALQIGMWAQPGQMGKGDSGVQNFMDMDRSIRSGGVDPGAKIAMAKALGIDRVTTRGKYWEFLERQEEGASPRNINAVLEQAEEAAGKAGLSKEEAAYQSKLNLKGMLGLSTRQINFWTAKGMRGLVKLIAEGDSNGAMSAVLNTPEGMARLKEAAVTPEELMSMIGNNYRQTDAQVEIADMKTGTPAAKLRNTVQKATIPFRPLPGALVETGAEMINGLTGSQRGKGAGQIFKEAGIAQVPTEENTGTLYEMLFGKNLTGQLHQPPQAGASNSAPPVVSLDQKTVDAISIGLDRLLQQYRQQQQPALIDMRLRR